MKHGTISTAITSTVVLGGSQYGTTLTVTSTGSVEPDTGANAIYGAAGLGLVEITNAGTLVGGSYGAPNGSAGIDLASASIITNEGKIVGGNEGGAGISLAASGTVHNKGYIAGGYAGGGYPSYTPGGVGVDLSSSGTLTNSGTIVGGTDATGYSGAGVVLAGIAQVSNGGSIIGGRGGGNSYEGGAGGAGITVETARSYIYNHGEVSGGNGGYGLNQGGNGGIGINFEFGGSLINHGTVEGGNGGHSRYYGGNGAVGVSDLSGYADITNFGTISGGYGAVGVDLAGGVLVAEAGLIQGGYGSADAVQFGSHNATLVVYGAARFSGNIEANLAATDTLVLAGKGGTLSGLGSAVNGFNDFTQHPNTDWTLNGAITGDGTFQLGGDDTLRLNGASVIPTIAFYPRAYPSSASTVILGPRTTVESHFAYFGIGDAIQLLDITASSRTYANGTLTLLDSAHHAVDKLFFSGDHTLADFMIAPIQGGTEVVFAGAAADPLPAHFGVAADNHGSAFDTPGGLGSWFGAWHTPFT